MEEPDPVEKELKQFSEQELKKYLKTSEGVPSKIPYSNPEIGQFER